MQYLDRLNHNFKGIEFLAGLGTCRLRDLMLPPSRLKLEGKILSGGFCHSLEDSIQQLKMMKRSIEIPIFIQPLIFGEKVSLNSRRLLEIGDAISRKKRGVLVVEWSSIKRYQIEGYDINPSYLGSQIVRKGGIEWLDWWTESNKGAYISDEEADRLSRNTGDIDMELFDREDLIRILKGLRITRSKNVEKLILDLNDELPDSSLVLVVPHKERGVSESIDENGLRGNDVPIIYLGSLVDKLGEQVLFKNNGRDLSHFEPGIEEAASFHFLDELSDTISGKDGEASSNDSVHDCMPMSILLVVDPRMMTGPIIRDQVDSWSTVYPFYLIRNLHALGHTVQMESIGSFVDGEVEALDPGQMYDCIIICHNYPSKSYGESFFEKLRGYRREGGLICSLCDDDFHIEYEDLRLHATSRHHGENQMKKSQIFWGSDPDLYYPEKDDILRILFDTWYYEEKEWDQTQELVSSALKFFENYDLTGSGKNRVELIAWGQSGPISISDMSEIGKIVHRPPRIPLQIFVEQFNKADVFMVTHSESMGLTVLDAAMAGCLVSIPQFERDNLIERYYIRPDLSSTVPCHTYTFNLEGIDPPWEEIISHVDSETIRNKSMQMTWKNLCKRIEESVRFRIGDERAILAPKSKINNIHRDRMLASVSLIQKDYSIENLSKYCFHWLEDENFDSISRANLALIARENINQFQDLSDDEILEKLFDFGLNEFVLNCDPLFKEAWDFFGYGCMNLNNMIGTSTGFEVVRTRIGKRYIGSKMNKTREEIRKFVMATTNGQLVPPAFSLLNDEDVSNWSLGRIIQKYFAEDENLMGRLTHLLPEELDLWKLQIRLLWNKGDHSSAISLAKLSIKHHPSDEWLVEISGRSSNGN